MNILIIEDDWLLWNNIKKIFDKNIITNRIKVLKSFQEFSRELGLIKSYDIILVDILLWSKEEQNWIEIIKEIRKKTTSIPIVIISWLDDIYWIESWFKHWANDYITKPFRLKELEIRVFKWFEMYFYTDFSGKDKISYEWIEYDLIKNEFYFNWKIMDLTKWNKYLFSLFLWNPWVLLKEDFLVEKIWWDVNAIIDRNLRVNILRLKSALKEYWIDERIQNIRWEWYMLKKTEVESWKIQEESWNNKDL